MLKMTRWDAGAAFFLIAGVLMLFASAGTSDLKSIVPNDPTLASDRTLQILAIAGCLSSVIGILCLMKAEKRKTFRKKAGK